ncbi:MAG: thiamine phosphate synthase [Candidatus Diapherotrites archaeon]|nr:thiamine phosphate synthase [Candidatus Diapherotrites archaeon]
MPSKNLNPKTWSVYFVTDRTSSASGNILQDVLEVARAGIPVIQYREKELPYSEKLKQAQSIKKICDRFGTVFVVNDDINLAIAVKADAIHVGQTDLLIAQVRERLRKAKLKMIIGVSVSNPRELKKALAEKPDYLGVGSIFRTKTKKDAGQPVGLTFLQHVSRTTRLPVIAIGGIKTNNLSAVLKAGAHGAAMISEISSSPNLFLRVQQLLHLAKKVNAQKQRPRKPIPRLKKLIKPKPRIKPSFHRK